jgi:hypothetical protein
VVCGKAQKGVAVATWGVVSRHERRSSGAAARLKNWGRLRGRGRDGGRVAQGFSMRLKWKKSGVPYSGDVTARCRVGASSARRLSVKLERLGVAMESGHRTWGSRLLHSRAADREVVESLSTCWPADRVMSLGCRFDFCSGAHCLFGSACTSFFYKGSWRE